MNGVPKRFLLLMAASIGLNLFFVGMFAARHLLPERARMHEGFGVRAFLHRSGLREAGPEAQAILRADRAQMRQRMRAIAEARNQVSGALQAVPFDRARLDGAFATLQERTAAMQQEAHTTLIKVAEKLNDAQRRRMGDAMWHRRGHGEF